MAKINKDYKLTRNGNLLTLTMNNKGADGKYHSYQVCLPYVVMEQDADGNQVVVRKTTRQLEKIMRERMNQYYPIG